MANAKPPNLFPPKGIAGSDGGSLQPSFWAIYNAHNPSFMCHSLWLAMSTGQMQGYNVLTDPVELEAPPTRGDSPPTPCGPQGPGSWRSPTARAGAARGGCARAAEERRVRGVPETSRGGGVGRLGWGRYPASCGAGRWRGWGAHASPAPLPVSGPPFSEGCRRACENFRERKWRWWQCRCTGTRSIGSAYEYCAKRMWPQAVPWPSDAIVALATRWQPGCRAQPDEGDGAPVAAARFQPASGVRPPHGKTARGGSAPTGASGSAAQARVLLIPASPSPSSWPRSSAASASPSSASFLIEVSFPPPSSPSTSPPSAQMPSRPTSDAPPRHAGRSR